MQFTKEVNYDSESEDLVILDPLSGRASCRADNSTLSEYTKAVNSEVSAAWHRLRDLEHARTTAGQDEKLMRVDAK